MHLTFHDELARRVRKGAGVALATAGLFAVTNYVLTPKGPVELRWLHGEAEALADARAANRPLLVDFMASWCLPCKEFELKVFSDPEVAAEMQAFTLLKVDLTREDDDPALGVIKKKYGAETLPAIRLVAPDGRVRAKTDELMTAQAFHELADRGEGGTRDGAALLGMPARMRPPPERSPDCRWRLRRLRIWSGQVDSPSSASMRARSKPSSSRPRTSMTGTRSVGMPILLALSRSSRAAAGSFSMSLSANGIFRSVRYWRAARQAPHHEVP